jgi:hypothetical protein
MNNRSRKEHLGMTSSTRASRWMSELLTPLDVFQRGLTDISCCRRRPLQETCIAEAGAHGKSLIFDGQTSGFRCQRVP